MRSKKLIRFYRKSTPKKLVVSAENKYKSDSVLDKSGNDISPEQKKDYNTSKLIELEGELKSLRAREAKGPSQIQKQSMVNRMFQGQLQDQFLNAQMMQKQLQNQSQSQHQKFSIKPTNVTDVDTTILDIIDKLTNELKNTDEYDPTYVDILSDYVASTRKKISDKKMIEDIKNSEKYKLLKKAEDKATIVEYGNLNSPLDINYDDSVVDDVDNMPELQNDDGLLVTELPRTSNPSFPIQSNGLVDEDYIKQLEGSFNPDILRDPLTQSHLYSDMNKWYVDALRQRNELLNQYNTTLDVRDKTNLEEVISGLENKLVKFEKTSSGILPIHKMNTLKEFFDLKQKILPKYHKYIDKYLYRRIVESKSKEDLLKHPIIKSIINNSSNSTESGSLFSSLWDKIKNGYQKTRNVISSVWNKFKDVGENAFKTIDNNPQILPMANNIIKTVTNRDIDISPYYTKTQDIFSRLPRISNGLTSMGLTSTQSSGILGDIYNAFKNKNNISLNDILKKNGVISSSGINNVLLSAGLVQDLIDLKMPIEDVEKIVGTDNSKHQKKLKKIIKSIKKSSNVDLTDDVFNNIFNKTLKSDGIIEHDDFMNLPEVIDIINNSKDKVMSSGFFDSLWNGLKNFGRNAVNFLAPAAPLVRQIAPLISGMPGIGQIISPVVESVVKGFDIIEKIKPKISGRGIEVNPESKKKLKKIAKF